MSASGDPKQEVAKPLAQQIDSASGKSAPLAALISALTQASQISDQASDKGGPPSQQDAQFTARLYSALSLQPDSLLSNIQRSRASFEAVSSLEAPQKVTQLNSIPSIFTRLEDGTADHSSAIACNSQAENVQAPADTGELNEKREDGEQETSSNANHTTSKSCVDLLVHEPHASMSEEAKKKRRQEINRESARRVRKRKSLEYQQLQSQVTSLQSAATSAAADQAVIVRYASELTHERDCLLQRCADLESKWLSAEVKVVALRQRIAELTVQHWLTPGEQSANVVHFQTFCRGRQLF